MMISGISVGFDWDMEITIVGYCWRGILVSAQVKTFETSNQGDQGDATNLDFVFFKNLFFTTYRHIVQVELG